MHMRPSVAYNDLTLHYSLPLPPPLRSCSLDFPLDWLGPLLLQRALGGGEAGSWIKADEAGRDEKL